jgi:hypothetical protein
MEKYKVTFITEANVTCDNAESCKVLVRKIRTAIKRGILLEKNVKIVAIKNKMELTGKK